MWSPRLKAHLVNEVSAQNVSPSALGTRQEIGQIRIQWPLVAGSSSDVEGAKIFRCFNNLGARCPDLKLPMLEALIVHFGSGFVQEVKTYNSPYFKGLTTAPAESFSRVESPCSRNLVILNSCRCPRIIKCDNGSCRPLMMKKITSAMGIAWPDVQAGSSKVQVVAA